MATLLNSCRFCNSRVVFVTSTTDFDSTLALCFSRLISMKSEGDSDGQAPPAQTTRCSCVCHSAWRLYLLRSLRANDTFQADDLSARKGRLLPEGRKRTTGRIVRLKAVIQFCLAGEVEPDPAGAGRWREWRIGPSEPLSFYRQRQRRAGFRAYTVESTLFRTVPSRFLAR